MTTQPTLAEPPAPAADVPAQPDPGALLEQVVIAGDLARLTPAPSAKRFGPLCITVAWLTARQVRALVDALDNLLLEHMDG